MTDFGDYEEFVKAADLDSISTVECAAVRLGEGESNGLSISMESSLRARPDDEAMDFRYEFQVRVHAGSSSEETIARLSAALVATYNTPLAQLAQAELAAFGIGEEDADDPHPELSETTIGRFGEDVAVMSVYPYARATIQQLGATIGLPSVVLPLFKRDVEKADSSEDRPAASATSEDTDRSVGERSEPS